MGDDPGRAEYSIASVSKLTGVSCHALRVWERRYGFPIPRRSPSGHRRYGADQVRVLRRITDRLRLGEPIGALMVRVREGTLPGQEEPEPGPSCPAAAGPSLALVDRLGAGDLAGADALYRAEEDRLDPLGLIVQILEPALVETGERWFRREDDVYQEHCASGFLRRKLGDQYDRAQRANPSPRRSAIVGTVQGDRHEGGVLIVCTLLELAGWRALNLGVDLPVREYQKAVDRWSPDALGVSFVLSRNINKRFQELARIERAPVFVGGRSVLNYQGLARRYGLIPLVGPAPAAVEQLMAQALARPPAAAGGPPVA